MSDKVYVIEKRLHFGRRSLSKLSECEKDLKDVFMLALSMNLIDISVFEGVREKAEQDRFFKIGKSKVKWPNGKHNIKKEGDKSKAVDAAPYVNGSISWKKEHCIFLAGVVLACAKILEIDVRWGGCWRGDPKDIGKQTLNDYVHFELVE